MFCRFTLNVKSASPKSTRNEVDTLFAVDNSYLYNRIVCIAPCVHFIPDIPLSRIACAIQRE